MSCVLCVSHASVEVCNTSLRLWLWPLNRPLPSALSTSRDEFSNASSYIPDLDKTTIRQHAPST